MSYEPLRIVTSAILVTSICTVYWFIVKWHSGKKQTAWAWTIGFFLFWGIYLVVPLPAIDHQWPTSGFMKYYIRDIGTHLMPVPFWLVGMVLSVYTGTVVPINAASEKKVFQTIATFLIGWGVGVPITYFYFYTH
ncbi:MAG: hypothetical protein HZC01_00040 [Candidatus Kerfeldbacteria bacterium]|nr:hypothetical protein [Candidatus Kerfeldbacteria bacterium]